MYSMPKNEGGIPLLRFQANTVLWLRTAWIILAVFAVVIGALFLAVFGVVAGSVVFVVAVWLLFVRPMLLFGRRCGYVFSTAGFEERGFPQTWKIINPFTRVNTITRWIPYRNVSHVLLRKGQFPTVWLDKDLHPAEARRVNLFISEGDRSILESRMTGFVQQADSTRLFSHDVAEGPIRYSKAVTLDDLLPWRRPMPAEIQVVPVKPPTDVLTKKPHRLDAWYELRLEGLPELRLVWTWEGNYPWGFILERGTPVLSFEGYGTKPPRGARHYSSAIFHQSGVLAAEVIRCRDSEDPLEFVIRCGTGEELAYVPKSQEVKWQGATIGQVAHRRLEGAFRSMPGTLVTAARAFGLTAGVGIAFVLAYTSIAREEDLRRSTD